MLKILWPCLPSLCCVLECWFPITAPNPLLTDFLHFPSSIGLQLVQILKYRISVHPFFQIPTQSVQVRAIHRPRMQRNETRLQLLLQTMAGNVSTLRDCHIRHEIHRHSLSVSNLRLMAGQYFLFNIIDCLSEVIYSVAINIFKKVDHKYK